MPISLILFQRNEQKGVSGFYLFLFYVFSIELSIKDAFKEYPATIKIKNKTKKGGKGDELMKHHFLAKSLIKNAVSQIHNDTTATKI